MKDENVNIGINVDTSEVDEATEKIKSLADEIRRFPPQVTIQGAKNCTINVYPSQTLFIERDGADNDE